MKEIVFDAAMKPVCRLFARSAALLVLFCAATLAHCSREQAELREDDLAYYVRTLSDNAYQGRESGSRYSRAAAAFIAQRYQRAGLTPPFVDQAHPNAAPSYFQEFAFEGGIAVEPGGYFRFTAENGEVQSPKSYVPLPLGYAGAAKGELIFLGFCLEAPGWNDFAGLATKDFEGRIAVCLRHGPGGEKNSPYRGAISFRSKYDALIKRKVAGVVFLGHEGFPAPEPSDVGGAASRRAPAVFVESAEVFRTFPFLVAAEKQMREESKPGTDVVGRVLGTAEMATRFREVSLPGFNVGAYLRPPRKDERVIIVGAHYDHIGHGEFSSLRGPGDIHNGADDNASGTAVVMELALMFKSLDDGDQPEDVDQIAGGESESFRIPKDVNVLFLNFDAEERGLFGSREFMQSKMLAPKNIAAMINLDMVGRLRAEKGLSVQGAQTADARWEKIIREAYAETGFADDLELRLVKGGGGPSDHSAFYSQQVPVAFLFTGGHREYHTPDDDAHLINFAGLKLVAEMTGRLVSGLAQLEHVAHAGAEQSLAFRRAPAEAMRSDFEFRVRLGIMPGDYSHDVGGLAVADVRDDAPVKRTGLRAGDVIIKLGGRKIRGIQDYMEFLGDASAQKEYEIVFKRGDQVLRGNTRLVAAP